MFTSLYRLHWQTIPDFRDTPPVIYPFSCQGFLQIPSKPFNIPYTWGFLEIPLSLGLMEYLKKVCS